MMSFVRSPSRVGLLVLTGALLTTTLAASGCASLSNKQKGGAMGAAAGAAAGGAIGRANGSTAKGAILGAIVGGATGAIIGHQMDQQAKELSLEIPGATIERVGEGINVTFASGLLFDFDSDVIKPGSASNLANLAASLVKYPNTELLIVGHTDAQGSDDYNQALSQRRADAASRFLSAQQVGASRLHASGRGEAEPIGSNDSDAGRQVNRRIEVAIFAGPKARAGQP